MDIAILSELLQDKGWQVSKKRRDHYLLKHAFKLNTACFVVPTFSSEQLPAGTLNAVARMAHAKKETNHWTTFINNAKNVNVILEKHAGGLWGRIEMPGLLMATYGRDADFVADTLRALLIEFALEKSISYCSLIATLPFVYVYDTTAIWSLVKQLKATHIAEQVGIDMELIGQFMTGNTYPSPEVATRLENSIHELGRQLLEISIR
jgi:predicted RNA binding protein YcfA (HicA-like mRNA interferase family)